MSVISGITSSRSLIVIIIFSSYTAAPSVTLIQMLYVFFASKSKLIAEFKFVPTMVKLTSSAPGASHENEYVCTSHISGSVLERVPINVHET